jgi:hypothetical protein
MPGHRARWSLVPSAEGTEPNDRSILGIADPAADDPQWSVKGCDGLQPMTFGPIA